VGDVVARATSALTPLRDPARAAEMQRYMKNVAPFLGIPAPDRRAVLKASWKGIDQPASAELGEAAQAFMALTEREYHYAGFDLIDRFRRQADDLFLDRYGTALLTTKPWWDTVDGLVSAAVSPLCKVVDQSALIEEWSESGNIWLIRSAITHQRGWKDDTDIPRVLELCDRHWGNREFFVAKGIGWALRDIARMNPASVSGFLDLHPLKNSVATREALRGIATAK
jgi:3-methyladenine DNA glycosylase AlkD